MNVVRFAWAWAALAQLVGCGSMEGLMPGAKTNAPAEAAASPALATPAAPALPEPPLSPPSSRSAVLSTSYSLDGVVLPTVRGQHQVETRADMRRTDSVQTFDNRLLRAMAGDGRSADIVRLDKKLLWALNPVKQTYTECPLTGCSKPGQPAPDKPKPEQPSKSSEPSCPLTLAKNELKVVPTGERKIVNNFNTERIQISWTLELEDKQQRRNSNRVMLDMWTTPEVGPIKEVQVMNQAFEKRWAQALSKSDNPLGAYVPREVMGALNGLMSKVGGANSKAMAGWASEMKKVHGYPMAMTISWNVEGNACGDSSSNSDSGSTPTTAGGLLGSLMGGGKSGTKSGALLSYSYEVKTIEVKPVSDTWFAPDSNYQRIQ